MTVNAPRSPWESELKTLSPKTALLFTFTGQPGLRMPVSTFREKMRCSTVKVTGSRVNASKKSALDGKSTTGVPVMPYGEMLPHMRALAGTDVATLVCQTTLPSTASSAKTSSDSVTAMTTALPPGPPSM